MPLIFTDRTAPGITRRADKDAFVYLSARGKPLRDPRVLKRVTALVIPPAWRDVWIATSPHAHIQATGFDAKGRLQYRYHTAFRAAQEEVKFSKLLRFAQILPKLRAAVRRDMGLEGLPRERTLATLVHLLETTLIRIGNDAYAKSNESFGLSTLTEEHIQLQGFTLTFEFKGKSGKSWNISIKDRRTANVMRACQELPGQRLFRYLDPDGKSHGITSHDVNAYLKEISGKRISAKDFRTWAGTVLCAIALGETPPELSKAKQKRQIAAALRSVAKSLGNTPAVCRSSYVHPALWDAHASGDLYRRMIAAERLKAVADKLKPHEQAVVRLLRSLKRVERRIAAEKAPMAGARLAQALAASLQNTSL